MKLRDLSEKPFELLVELERRAKQAIADREGGTGAIDEWVGVAFRIGSDQFVAPRDEVREVLPIPEMLTRVPGAKPWLKGIANVRGHLLPIADLKAFLGGGISMADRHARVLVVNHRESPTGLMVDEVTGFRRFDRDKFKNDTPHTVVRCEGYLDGVYRTGGDSWPVFSLFGLVEDELFLQAAE